MHMKINKRFCHVNCKGKILFKNCGTNFGSSGLKLTGKNIYTGAFQNIKKFVLNATPFGR